MKGEFLPGRGRAWQERERARAREIERARETEIESERERKSERSRERESESERDPESERERDSDSESESERLTRSASVDADEASQRRSRPPARPRLVPACPKVCTGHVLYVHEMDLGEILLGARADEIARPPPPDRMHAPPSPATSGCASRESGEASLSSATNAPHARALSLSLLLSRS